MSIEAKLNDDLKNAMRAKNADLVACIRQLRSKVQEAVNTPGFEGPQDDAFYQRIITTYVKSLEKGISELEAAGERGKPLRDRYAAEIAYLKQYLPTLLGEAATRELVMAAIAKVGATDASKVGAVVGAVMKEHKGSVDAGLVRRLADSQLPKKS